MTLSTKAGATPQAVHPNPATVDEVLWTKARGRLASDQRWTAFEAHFETLRGSLTITDILQGFEDDRNLFEKEQLSINIPFAAGKSFKPRDVFAKIISYLENFKDIGGAIAACDPTKHAPIAWNILQYLVSLASKSKQINDLVYQHETIANIVLRGAIFAERYCSGTKRLNAASLRMELSIVDLYSKLLAYLLNAYHWTTRSSIYHALHTLGPSDPVTKAFKEVTDAETIMCKCEDAARVEVAGQIDQQVQYLEQMLHNLTRPMKDMVEQVDQIHAMVGDERYEKILQWVSPIQSVSRYQIVKKRHMPGTGGWLLRHPMFESWMLGEESASIWLHGEIGSGKSVLASLVVEEMSKIVKKSPNKQLAYFFCDSTNSNRQRELEQASTIYNDLLKQMLRRQKKAIPDYVVEDFDDKGTDGFLDEQLCLDALKDMLGQCQESIIVIDAIDECPTLVRQDILNNCLQMLWDHAKRQGMVLKIFVSSKPETDIRMFFEETHPESALGVDNAKDIKTFVLKKVDADFRAGLFTQDMNAKKQDMINGVLSLAHGMQVAPFRWVHLAIEALHKCTPENIDATLKDLPPKLKGMYEKIYSELELSTPSPSRDLIRIALCFIMYQQVKLTSTEILAAIFGDSNTETSKLRDRITKLCSHLVLYDKSTDELRLQHHSVGEYLKTRREFQEPQAHATIAGICLQQVHVYFNEISHKRKPCWKLRESISYALTHWPNHLVQGWTGRFSEPKLQQLLFPASGSFSGHHTVERWIWSLCLTIEKVEHTIKSTPQLAPAERNRYTGIKEQNPSRIFGPGDEYEHKRFLSPLKSDEEIRLLLDRTRPHDSNPISNPLFAFSVWQIGEIVDNWEQIPEEAWSIINAEEDTPIEDFCSRLSPERLDDFIRYTPKRALNAVFSRDNAFVLAAVNANYSTKMRLKMLKQMLDHGAKIDQGQSLTQTALHLAAKIDSPPIIDLLVQHGVSVNASDPQGRTPLHYACQFGSLKAVKRLCEHNVHLEARDSGENTPFLIATAFDRVAVADFLVSLQVDTRAVDQLGNNGFLLSARSAEPSTVMMEALIQTFQFDIDYRNHEGESALHLVCSSNIGLTDDKIDFLLNTGIQINSLTCQLKSALHYATESEGVPRDVVMKLLQAGIDIDLADDLGMTALLNAIDQGNVDVVCLLLESDANINARSADGNTVLHYAAGLGPTVYGHEILNMLLSPESERIDPNQRNLFGATPLDIATLACNDAMLPTGSHKRLEFEKILEQAGGKRVRSMPSEPNHDLTAAGSDDENLATLVSSVSGLPPLHRKTSSSLAIYFQRTASMGPRLSF